RRGITGPCYGKGETPTSSVAARAAGAAAARAPGSAAARRVRAIAADLGGAGREARDQAHRVATAAGAVGLRAPVALQLDLVGGVPRAQLGAVRGPVGVGIAAQQHAQRLVQLLDDDGVGLLEGDVALELPAVDERFL